jgi:hypothetical protein
MPRSSAPGILYCICQRNTRKKLYKRRSLPTKKRMCMRVFESRYHDMVLEKVKNIRTNNRTGELFRAPFSSKKSENYHKKKETLW